MKQCSAVHDRVFAAVFELFPINSDSFPKEEKQKHYEVLPTYAKHVLNGPRDLSSPKGVHLTTNMSSAQPVQAPPCQVPFQKSGKNTSIRERNVGITIIVEPHKSVCSSPFKSVGCET